MNEGMKAKLSFTWPNGKVQERLEPKTVGLVWQHLHHGHDAVYRDCYACVCEEAY
jgi:hypothetical protein